MTSGFAVGDDAAFIGAAVLIALAIGGEEFTDAPVVGAEAIIGAVGVFDALSAAAVETGGVVECAVLAVGVFATKGVVTESEVADLVAGAFVVGGAVERVFAPAIKAVVSTGAGAVAAAAVVVVVEDVDTALVAFVLGRVAAGDLGVGVVPRGRRIVGVIGGVVVFVVAAEAVVEAASGEEGEGKEDGEETAHRGLEWRAGD